MTDVLDRIQQGLADRYTVERELGSGGMATVYLAHDIRHDRKVAVKVLRPELAAILGAERFLNEIKVTAHLQHPHILPLFDSGEADGFLFYVMPHVEGESLQERLQREKQVPVCEAVQLIKEIASALHYAHRHDVIHRDIKPGNVLLQDGQAMVADFGIALAVTAAGGDRITETGLSLGTPEYMSPEQATGDRQVDARSDLYSLGAMLYEMLTGEPPHTGKTVQAIIAKVVTDRPRPVTELRDTVPVHIAAAIEQALEKLPADRFATVSDFAAALDAPGTTVSRGSTVRMQALDTRAARRPWAFPAAVGVAGIAVVLAVWGWLRPAPSAVGPVVYDVGLADSVPISFTGGSPWGEGWPGFTASADGRFVVYVAERDTATELWYRSLMDETTYVISGTAGAYHPMLAPDGNAVAFFSRDRLQAVAVEGGAPYTIGTVDRPVGGLWLPGGDILVADRVGSVMRWYNPARRGVTDSVAVSTCYQPFPAADGAGLLCSSSTTLEMRVVDVETGVDQPLQWSTVEPSHLSSAPLLGTHLRLLPHDRLLFVSVEGDLWATELDPHAGVVGQGVRVLRGVRREGFSGAAQYAVTETGSLIYAPGVNAGIGRFVRVRQDGVEEVLAIAPGPFRRFDLSPDETSLAVVHQGLNEQELWVYDVRTGRGGRWVTGFWIGEPRWTATGNLLAVTIESGPRTGQELLVGDPATARAPDVIPLDAGFSVSEFLPGGQVLGVLTDRYLGQRIALARVGSGTLTVDSVFAPRGEAAVGWPTLSPDRRWLAYVSSETGRYDVVVESFPDRGNRFRATLAGGLEPLWTGPGSLVFRDGRTWYEVRLTSQGGAAMSEPRALFVDSRFVDTPGRSQIVTRDGSVIYVRANGRSNGSFLRVIPNWSERLADALEEPAR